MRKDSATGELRDDHQVILKVLDVLEVVMPAGTSAPDFTAVRDCIAFFRLYADACHHGMEEDLLFPELESQGIPSDSGPVASLLEDHRIGRGFVRQMAASIDAAEAGDARALSELRSGADGYLDLLRGHIDREDHGVFEMADNLVTGTACSALCDAYEEVCARRFEGRTKDELEALASSPTARYPDARGNIH